MSSLTGEPGHTTSTERTRAVIDAWDLQRIAELGWPGTEVAHVAGWSVRAGRGFTRRANSALPLGPSTANLDERLAAVRAWYGERDLPTLLQVPEPAGADLASELSARGWARGTAVSVQTASAETILSRCSPPADLPAPITTTVPDERWLALYHYRGGDLPPKALEVLTAGERPLFHTLVMPDGAVAGICRTTVSAGWLGLAAVEVADTHRRRGVATHLLREAIGAGLREGAGWAYLQVEDGNTAGLALYDRAGFTTHHTYAYWQR